MQELAHTSATLAAMEVSHGQLNKTKDEYVGQHSLLKRSKGLLRTITWQNKSETLLLWGGLILFALVAAYVAQKRAMYFVPESLRPMALVRTAVWVVKGGKGHGRPQPPPPPPPPPKGRLAPANGLETPSVGRNGEINVSADGVGQPKEAKMERRAGLEGMASETAGSNQQAKPSDSGAVSSGSGLPERIQDEPQKKIEL